MLAVLCTAVNVVCRLTMLVLRIKRRAETPPPLTRIVRTTVHVQEESEQRYFQIGKEEEEFSSRCDCHQIYTPERVKEHEGTKPVQKQQQQRQQQQQQQHHHHQQQQQQPSSTSISAAGYAFISFLCLASALSIALALRGAAVSFDLLLQAGLGFLCVFIPAAFILPDAKIR